MKPRKIKKKIKVWKDLRIDIERIVEETTQDGITDYKTLYYLVNAKYSDGRGVGFRANTQIECWIKLMQGVDL